MRILVIGGSSVIGSQFLKYFHKEKIHAQFTYLTHPFAISNNGYILDITKKDDVVNVLTKIHPDVIIHTAALTNVDLCETNKPLANSLNVNGTANVIDACKSIQSKLVYISTSSVFDGKKEKYFETDTPSPTTYYGATKQSAEKLVKESGLPYLILRTDQPYCWIEKWQHTNSVLRVLEKLGNNQNFNEITDWYNTPTYVPEFIHASFDLIKKDAHGIFHVVGSDFISRYEWSLHIADTFKLDKKLIRPISSDTLGLPVKRPNVYLSNDKLYQQTGIKMMGIRDGLIKMLNDAEKNHYTK